MPITRKPGPAQSVSLIGTVPDPPPVPAEVLDRFPAMKAYQAQMDSWWSQFKGLYMRDRDVIRARFTENEAGSVASGADLQAQLDALKAQIAAL